jgi:hypothetical protein
LPPNSVLVIANAPYHNVQFNKAPTSQTTKVKLMEWFINFRLVLPPLKFMVSLSFGSSFLTVSTVSSWV